MNIFENPFYILGVSSRHNRRQINSLAEEKIFMNDSESKTVNDAVNRLIISEKRLAAEIRWFPGIDHRKIKGLIEFFRRLNTGKPANRIDMSCLRGVALLNFAVYMFNHRRFRDIDEIIKSLLAMGRCFDTLHTESVCIMINDDRKAAGFPLVQESEIERELHDYRSDVIRTLNERLSSLSKEKYLELSEKLAVKYADEGDYHGSLILSDLIDSYELNIMPQLEEYETRILDILNGINEASEVNPEVLLSPLKKWKRISRPLLLASESRGMKNTTLNRQGFNFLSALREGGNRIFDILSDVNVDLQVKHKRTQYMLRLTLILKENLADISLDLSKKIDRDIQEIKDLNDKIKEAEEAYKRIKQLEERRYNEWAKSIYYETEFGLIFKDKFRISADGILYGRNLTPLDDITGISWGGIQHYTNGFHTSTEYELAFQTSQHTTRIKSLKQKVYEEIISRLWKAVAPSIGDRILKQLRNGEMLYFGEIQLYDNGVLLNKTGLFSSDTKFFAWKEPLSIYSYNGSFVIEERLKGKYSAKSSYLYDMNTHILETIIRQFFKIFNSRNPVLSSLLNT